jgi:hypothetical protein
MADRHSAEPITGAATPTFGGERLGRLGDEQRGAQGSRFLRRIKSE